MVFREHYDVQSVYRLRELLQHREGEYGCFWLSQHKDGFPGIVILINGDLACMIYFRDADDGGLYSLGPSAAEDEGVDFAIDNHQVDQHPRCNCVSTKQALAAATEFFQTLTQPKMVSWAKE
jgi:hypothetical protein